MKKLIFSIFLFTVLFHPTQLATVKAKKSSQNTASIVGIVVARERANKDYSLGISLNSQRDKEIDEVHFKVPFKYNPKVGFQDKGWNTIVKGKTVTIKRKDKNPSGSEKAENQFGMSSVNFRLDYAETFRVKIPSRLKTPIEFNAFSKGKSIFKGKAKVHFMAKVGLNDGNNVVFLPGRIPQGGFFSSVINDNTEQLIQN